VSSGSLPTIQARLRADLYAAIQEQASDPALRLKPKESNANVNLPTRCLNWLVGQHLSSQRCWLTTSLMASETEFPDFGPPKAAVEGMLGERGKQYCTETLSREKLAELLRVLNFPSETIDQVSQAYFSSPQVSLLSILLSALPEPTSTYRDETNKKASVPSSNQEVGLETKLSLIEGKYEKILQQVEEKRREVVKSRINGAAVPEKVNPSNNETEVRMREDLERKERKRAEKEARRREKLLRRQESLETSSSTIGSIAESDIVELRQASGGTSHRGKDLTIRKLFQKMEEFLVSQEEEKKRFYALSERLASAEGELKLFSEKEKQWDAEKIRNRNESEDMARMTQLVSEQIAKLAEQAKVIQELKVQVEVGKQEKREGVREEEQENTLVQENFKGKSPTEDFLREAKEKMEELSREQVEIDDEFEDFNETSLRE